MASNVKSGKRRHVMTEKMQAFVRAQTDANSPVRLLHCPHEGCNKVLTSSPGLRYHLKAHFQDRPFSCDRCNKTFKSSNGLKYHLSKTKCVFPPFQKWLMTMDTDNPNFYPTLSSASEEDDDEEEEEDGGPGLGSISDTDFNQTSAARALKRSKSMDDSRSEGVSGAMAPIKEKSVSGGSVVYVKPDGSVVTAPSGRLTPAVECDEENEFNDTRASTQTLSPNASVSTESCSSPKAMSTLEELAIFATSMQSPLVRRTPPTVLYEQKQDSGIDTESSQDTGDVPSLDTDETYSVTPVDSPLKAEPSDSESRVTSSSPYPAQTTLQSGVGNWSHSWPDTVWQCFTRGTRARFISGKNTEWQLVEDIAETEELTTKACLNPAEAIKRSYAPNGLKLLHIEEVQSKEVVLRSILRLRFVSTTLGQAEILVESEPDHPFFVRNKGWSSFHPSQTVKRYGIPCNELESGDICLPPDHPDATYSKDIFECMKNYQFTPMDSSAVFTLSNMAKRRHQSPPDHRSSYPGKKRPKIELKTKRPMNAFMLFAKQFRLQYTQAYPGKDNRAISILLGDQWKRLSPSQRQVFSRQSKKLAEQQRISQSDPAKKKVF